MNDLKIKTVFQNYVKQHVKWQKFSGMYAGKFMRKNIILLVHEVTLLLVSSDLDPCNIDLSKEVLSSCNFEGKVEIVGNEKSIYLMNSKGGLWKLSCNFSTLVLNEELSFCWSPESPIKDGKVLAIKEHEGKISIILAREQEQEIYFFRDINDDTFIFLKLKNLHRSTVFHEVKESLVMPFLFNGNYWVAFMSGGKLQIYSSDVKVISTIKIKSQDCQLICFENGKLLATSKYCNSSCSVFLTKNIVCIEKCFCSDTCLLWSDGVNFHHTELIFSEDGLKVKHFEVQCNVTGIITFVKFCNSIIAVTVNNVYYHIIPDCCILKKEIMQNLCETLSEIYNESLKINEFQKNLETASEYLNFKDVIQRDNDKIELNWEGNTLTIKNTLGVTFKKEFWKIKLIMTIQKCEYVKVVDFETDLLKEMTVRVQNPFDSAGRVKVYFVGEFKWEVLHFYVGVIGEEVDFRKENLKKMLNEINHHRNLNCPKI